MQAVPDRIPGAPLAQRHSNRQEAEQTSVSVSARSLAEGRRGQK